MEALGRLVEHHLSRLQVDSSVAALRVLDLEKERLVELGIDVEDGGDAVSYTHLTLPTKA